MKVGLHNSLIVLVLLLICCFCTFSNWGDKDFAISKREVLLRKIGHELLLRAGDKTSPVLPVEKSADNVYRIKFGKEFTFKGDSLRAIVNHILKEDPLAKEYIVSVSKYPNSAMIFGYVKSDNEKQNVNPCSGRIQLKGNYIIDIRFKEKTIAGINEATLIGGLPIIAFIGFLAFKRTFKKRDNNTTNIEGVLKIGNTQYDSWNKEININGLIIPLTIKENKILLIFANHPNIIIPRNRLQKEIWEDEGVIVGRSLDMFISKLRKKLENDPHIQLMNIHGKGYKLAVSVS